MNREIKFRAWNDIDKTMIEWKTIKCFPTLLCNLILGKIKHHTVVQYTGRKDKNGVEIYERDVVTGLNGRKYEVKHGEFQDAVISYDEDYDGSYGWYIDMTNVNGDEQCESIMASEDTLTIIGNIYENPELLEENKESN